MTTTSRTYLPTDWQVWTYAPVAGKFRLDFSALDGSDVLGGVSDEGGMAVLDLNISSIMIQDGQQANQSVFGVLSPGTATITASYQGWSADLVKDLYPGKYIAITLKNEAAVDVDVYGRNSVYFLGTISSSNYEVDPINLVTTFNIDCDDIFSNAVNQSLEVAKSSTSTKASVFNAALLANSNLFDPHLDIITAGDMTVNFEATATESRSLGEWVDDFLTSYVAIPLGTYANVLGNLERQLTLQALWTQPTSGTQITGADITNIIMATDGGNIPTSFNLSNSTVSYNFAPDIDSVLTTPVNYSTTLDVNGVTQLQQVADRISTYVPELSPTEITVRTATSYQPIVFDTAQPQSYSQYYYPQNWYANGTDVDVYLDFFATGGTTPHYYTKIVGQSHEITPDYWHTTYQLLKGR